MVSKKIKELKTLDDLTADRANANRGTERGRKLVRKSLQDLGAGRSILADAHGTIIAGNKTLEAARDQGLPVRVVATDGSELVVVQRTDLDLSDPIGKARRLAYADNRAGQLGLDWDAAQIAADVEAGIDLGDLGFDKEQLKEILSDAQPDTMDGSTYTNKITIPIYEPKGEKPPVSALFDRTKTAQLDSEIDAADIPEEVAHFLHLAAERHTVFNFRQIAEFYCHADANVKDLMERSALVIIDYNKAIEYGFVHLTERLGALADQEASDAG